MTIEEQLGQYVRFLHDQMRMIYAIPSVNMLDLGKLEEVKRMELGRLSQEPWPYIDPDGILQGSKVLSRQEEIKFAEDLVRAAKDKTLLSKPHPQGCICPKCQSFPAHVLPIATRIGDAERDQALDFLRERFESGHITLTEFEARKDAALAATMRDELDYLIRDLPPAEKKKIAVPQEPRRDFLVLSFLVRLASACFPVMAAITILLGAGLVSAAVLAILGGVAAMVLSWIELR